MPSPSASREPSSWRDTGWPSMIAPPSVRLHTPDVSSPVSGSVEEQVPSGCIVMVTESPKSDALYVVSPMVTVFTFQVPIYGVPASPGADTAGIELLSWRTRVRIMPAMLAESVPSSARTNTDPSMTAPSLVTLQTEVFVEDTFPLYVAMHVPSLLRISVRAIPISAALAVVPPRVAVEDFQVPR